MKRKRMWGVFDRRDRLTNDGLSPCLFSTRATAAFWQMEDGEYIAPVTVSWSSPTRRKKKDKRT